uniref:LysR substrate-binding domain-containing protein n=1 Tax=Rhodoferax sp. OV413 TaxID=1855285 RepID=UPI0025FDDBC2
DHSLQACSATEVAGVKGIEVTSLLTLVQMVSSGLGVALLPELAIQGGLLNGSSLQARPLAPPAPVRTIALVTRPTSAHMAEFEAIADLIAAASRTP